MRRFTPLCTASLRRQATRRVTLLSIVTSLLLPLASAADYQTDSVIRDVTVYPQSAKVIRVASFEVDRGVHNLTINDLPEGLIQNSLRIRLEDDNDTNLTLGPAHITQEIVSQSVQIEVQQLNNLLESLQDKQAILNDDKDRYSAQIDLIRQMMQTSGDASAYQSLPMDQWTQAWQLIDTQVAGYQAQIRDIDNSLETLADEEAALKQKLSTVGPDNRSTYAATLSVQADDPGTVDLLISYQINGAYWSPLYDVNLTSQNGSVDLSTFASIEQRTGENWQAVNLTLSTRRPNERIEVPSLTPWEVRIRPEQAPNAAKRSHASDGLMGNQIMMDMAAPMPAQAEMAIQDVQTINTEYNTEFSAPTKFSLTSGSDSRRILLTEAQYASELEIITTPQQDPRAIIVSNIAYTAAEPLLPGEASLYQNEQYVGNAYFDLVQPGADLRLAMGVDDRIDVKFQPDPERKSESGLFSKQSVEEKHYLISLRNEHDSAQKITVLGRFPIAIDERIEVERLGDAPDRKNIEDRQGVVAWDIETSGPSEHSIRYGYRVSHPSDTNLQGL